LGGVEVFCWGIIFLSSSGEYNFKISEVVKLTVSSSAVKKPGKYLSEVVIFE